MTYFFASLAIIGWVVAGLACWLAWTWKNASQSWYNVSEEWKELYEKVEIQKKGAIGLFELQQMLGWVKGRMPMDSAN